MMALKVKGIIKVFRFYLLGSMNICTKIAPLQHMSVQISFQMFMDLSGEPSGWHFHPLDNSAVE